MIKNKRLLSKSRKTNMQIRRLTPLPQTKPTLEPAVYMPNPQDSNNCMRLFLCGR